MSTNRSMPTATVIPELAYPDVGEAVDWLCRAFSFTERLRIAESLADVDPAQWGGSLRGGQRVE